MVALAASQLIIAALVVAVGTGLESFENQGILGLTSAFVVMLGVIPSLLLELELVVASSKVLEDEGV